MLITIVGRKLEETSTGSIMQELFGALNASAEDGLNSQCKFMISNLFELGKGEWDY